MRKGKYSVEEDRIILSYLDGVGPAILSFNDLDRSEASIIKRNNFLVSSGCKRSFELSKAHRSMYLSQSGHLPNDCHAVLDAIELLNSKPILQVFDGGKK